MTADEVGGTISGTAAGITGGRTAAAPCGSDIPVRAVAAPAADVGAAGTMRGPEGSNESSPRPSARRFSTGLCSSTALMFALLYI
ncbi:MAG: hypothetical protein DMG97_34370 [Acidobacteria bacterium]|nr:MAG: hypothetical protein DMG97_34370 [Acidobacteriota bacterium]